jgi:hypothetical protein
VLGVLAAAVSCMMYDVIAALTVGYNLLVGAIFVPMHLAVRATPSGSEALRFAVLMAVRNFFMWGSDWLGSALIESLHMPFSTLVYINAGTTLRAVPLALVLPKVLVSARDTAT